jgi:ribosomal protein S18 acetylase RimI-like enzyme
MSHRNLGPKPWPGSTIIGSKVSIRLHQPDGGFQDLLGILESPNSIRRRDGSLAVFDPISVALWRLVPAWAGKAGTGSPLSFRISELEEVAEITWPATEICDHGKWRYRMSNGFTRRANSVRPFGSAPLGEPDQELALAIKSVISEFQIRNLLPTIHISLPTYEGLLHLLLQKGWESKITAHVMVADHLDVITRITSQLAPGNPHLDKTGNCEVHFESHPSNDWLDVQGDFHGAEIMSRHPASYVTISFNGEIVGCGRIAQHANWAIITRLFVRSKYRGVGWSKIVILELIKHVGGSKLMLQVDETNSVAISLYEKLGFRFHHIYKYVVFPSLSQKL